MSNEMELGMSSSFLRPYFKYKVWLQSLGAPDDVVNLPQKQFEKLKLSFHSLLPDASHEEVDGVFMQFFESWGGERWRIPNQDWFSGIKERRNKDFFFESFEKLFQNKDNLLYTKYHRTKGPQLKEMIRSIKNVFKSDIEKNALTIIVRYGIYDWGTVFKLAQSQWINNLTRSMKTDLQMYMFFSENKIPDWHTWNSSQGLYLEEMVTWKIKLEFCDKEPDSALLQSLTGMVRKNYIDRYIWIYGVWLATLGAPRDIVFLPRERAEQLNDSITTFCQNLSPDSSLEEIDKVIDKFFENEARRLGRQGVHWNWVHQIMTTGNREFFFRSLEWLSNSSRGNMIEWTPANNGRFRTLILQAKREFHAYARQIWDQDNASSLDWVDLFFFVREAWMKELKESILNKAASYTDPTPWNSAMYPWYSYPRVFMEWAMKWKAQLEVCVGTQDADFFEEFQRMAKPYERRMSISSFQSKPVCKICSKPI